MNSCRPPCTTPSWLSDHIHQDMSGTSRHKACNHCREKKIRCDGGQPCRRCQNNGDNCDYSTQTKPTKLDLTQALEAFNNRLFHAESTLAAQQNVSSGPYPAVPTAAFDADNMALWSQPMGVQQSMTERNITPYPAFGQTSTSSMDIQPPMDFANPSFDSFPPNPNLVPMNLPMPPYSTAVHGSPTTSLPQLGDTSTTFPLKEYSSDRSDWGKLQNSASVSRNWTSSNLSSRITTPGTPGALSEALDTIPQQVAEDLFQRYSETVHHYFPMIDGHRFQSRAQESPSRSELVSLRFAIWAHAAIFDSRYSHLSDKFYLQARKYIEVTEAEAPNRFFTVPALQALILLAFYEFKQKCFTRSWVSVSRATWLAHSLGLHRMDTIKPDIPSTMLNILPRTDDAMEVEERRRTFWVMLQLNCLSTVGICWNLGLGFDHDEISTHLPVDEVNPGEGITLGEALKTSVGGLLCPLQGTALVSSLSIRSVTHVSQVHKEHSFDAPGYDFWTHHHHLNEILNHASNSTLAHLKPIERKIEPNVVFVNVILQSSIICVHQAVIYRVSRVEKRTTPVVRVESEQRCFEAVQELISAIGYIGQISTAKLNPFVPWAFYVALQYLVRREQAYSQTNPRVLPDSPQEYSLTSPIGHHDSRQASGNTSHRFGAFHTKPSTTSLENGHRAPGRQSSAKGTVDSARSMDWMNSLSCRLQALKATIPLARVFEAQIEEEIEGGEAVTRERLVGLVRYLPRTESMRSNSNHVD